MSKSIYFKIPEVKCTACSGSGRYASHSCGACEGTGKECAVDVDSLSKYKISLSKISKQAYQIGYTDGACNQREADKEEICRLKAKLEASKVLRNRIMREYDEKCRELSDLTTYLELKKEKKCQ